MTSGSGVWVLVGHENGRLLDGSLEAIGEARKMAQKTGQDLSAVLLAEPPADQVQLLAQHGATRVLLLEHPSLGIGSMQTDAHVLSVAVEEHAPAVVVAVHSVDGADMAARIATRLGTGLVTGCDRIDIADDGVLSGVRPVYGGKASATVVCARGHPRMATVNPDAIDLKIADPSAAAEIERLPIDATPTEAASRVVDFLRGDPRLMSLTEAEIVVAGGMGLGSRANFALVEELADAIGGSVAATRRAVDEEWVGSERQVGLTGKTVRPKLYIACGISGAIQHTMGMKDARAIVAINTDRNAPILKMADVGVIGDVVEILPALTARMREAIGESRPTGAGGVLDALSKAA